MNNQTAAAQEIEERDKLLFDAIAERYAQKDIVQSSALPRRYQLERVVEPMRQLGRPAHCILEIACGIGATASFLKGRYENYFGLDHSGEMIRIAQWFNRDNPSATFFQANVKESYSLPMKADVVLAMGALHHMTELDQVFAAIKKNVNPGALFLAFEPASENPVVELLRATRARLDSGFSEDQESFTAQQMTALLTQNGLQAIRIRKQGYFSPPFAQVVLNPQIVTSPLARMAVGIDSLLDRYCSTLVGRLSWNMCIEARFPER